MDQQNRVNPPSNGDIQTVPENTVEAHEMEEGESVPDDAVEYQKVTDEISVNDVREIVASFKDGLPDEYRSYEKATEFLLKNPSNLQNLLNGMTFKGKPSKKVLPETVKSKIATLIRLFKQPEAIDRRIPVVNNFWNLVGNSSRDSNGVKLSSLIISQAHDGRHPTETAQIPEENTQTAHPPTETAQTSTGTAQPPEENTQTAQPPTTTVNTDSDGKVFGKYRNLLQEVMGDEYPVEGNVDVYVAKLGALNRYDILRSFYDKIQEVIDPENDDMSAVTTLFDMMEDIKNKKQQEVQQDKQKQTQQPKKKRSAPNNTSGNGYYYSSAKSVF